MEQEREKRERERKKEKEREKRRKRKRRRKKEREKESSVRSRQGEARRGSRLTRRPPTSRSQGEGGYSQWRRPRAKAAWRFSLVSGPCSWGEAMRTA
jgi:hypothetical protein